MGTVLDTAEVQKLSAIVASRVSPIQGSLADQAVDQCEVSFQTFNKMVPIASRDPSRA